MAKQKLLLHIEDDPDQREMLESKLPPKCAYLGVESAEEAEQHLADKNLRIIILDLALPLMNGFEFLKKNRRHIMDRRIPVIITTGLEGAGIEPLVEEHRCAAYFKKPFDPHLFFSKVQELIA